jgi:hypothetical protein
MEFQSQPADPSQYLPPRPEGTAAERAADIRERLHRDMYTTLVSRGHHVWDDQEVIDALCDDAMFQIEHLLVEIEAGRVH